MKQLIFLLTAFIIYSCDNRKKEKKSLLVGTWYNTYMKIEMNTYQGKDSINILEVDELNWVKKMGIKPIITYFKEDGTYNSEHRNLNDSIIYNPAGNWFIKGDSLFMNDTFPKKELNYKYKFDIRTKGNETVAEFWGQEDFDQDGLKDDFFYSKQYKK